jgi:biotin operon repressor
MNENGTIARLQVKTPEQRFMRLLEQEFQFAPRVAQVILAEAQANLLGQPGQLRPGQVRVILAKRQASHGRPLRETATVEVTWTIDAGAEDQQVQQQHGVQGLRRVRLQRLLTEALEQDGVASQEDLARVLQVSVRTIKRDIKALSEQGLYLPTRGNLHGIGRGQTHKAQIIQRWLQGQTYDQIALQTRHSNTAINRYVQTFVRVIELHQQDFADSQIALLLQIGVALVQEYLAVYVQNDQPACRERLKEQLQRLSGADRVKKGAP